MIFFLFFFTAHLHENRGWPSKIDIGTSWTWVWNCTAKRWKKAVWNLRIRWQSIGSYTTRNAALRFHEGPRFKVCTSSTSILRMTSILYYYRAKMKHHVNPVMNAQLDRNRRIRTHRRNLSDPRFSTSLTDSLGELDVSTKWPLFTHTEPPPSLTSFRGHIR